MLVKSLFVLAAIAATSPVLAEEWSNCTQQYTQDKRHNITSIDSETSFCTMMPPRGVSEVAPAEACANSMCYGKIANPGQAGYEMMPEGFIRSAHFVNNATNGFKQITGCIDSSLWNLNPLDQGGQMDSHGWQYKCQGYSKFISLMEPATNTFCIRCCNTDVNSLCDTSHSTLGCWNLIPGQYTMPDGSACPPPSNTTSPSGVPSSVSGTASATVSGTATVSVPGSTASGAPGSATNSGTSSTGSPSNKPSSAKSLTGSLSWEMMGMVATGAMALAAAL